ncbi:MAG: UPF0182 family protein [Acidimicrobiales bacterium]
MRVPENATLSRPHRTRHYQLAILIVVMVAIFGFLFLQGIADAYTNYLWYRSIHLTMIWRSMVETKLVLGFIFSGLFFIACWASLWVVDAVAPAEVYLAPEFEVVRRYRATFGRFKVTVRTVVSLLLGLAVGSGTSGQWEHWLMFVNGGSFGAKDPQFHRNVGFYVFRLPFLSFLVDWSLVALLVLLIVTTIGHYLNGSLRSGGPRPRIDSKVTAHLSLILALMALVRAAGYFFVDRYGLDLSTNGVVAGAGYTDVHVRLPALSILAIVSMIGFILLTYNVYHRTWALPAVAVGMWIFVAMVAGVIFPAIIQWLEVTPSQSTVELPYIQRNIAATRAAFGLNSITPQAFAAHVDLNAGVVNADRSTLGELPLWNPQVAANTYDDLQALHGYYQLAGLSTDRYQLGTGADRALTPVVIGTRELLQSGEPRNTWVNEHLVYTHGYGVMISPANTATNAGQPDFAVQGAPVQSSPGAPHVTQPDIYFGDSSSSYVVVDTRQAELDYVRATGSKPKTTHYAGTGGVRLAGFWQRAAFAMRFHDYNLLVSKLITPRSRIIYLQNVEQRVQRAAPFLKVDSHPYPVVAGGRIYWMVDCYTTSDYYPYSQNASTGLLPYSSGLQGQYNYVRDSVKAVVNAYTGQVSFFAADPSDPVLIAWEHSYPGMIKPLRDMAALSPQLLDHLRYPQDLLTVLSSMYGRYHFLPNASQAAQFYSLQDAWNVAQATNGVSYTPTYELVRLPGQSSAHFIAIEPLVPQSTSGKSQLLAGFVTASSNYKDYGSLTAYELPRVTPSALGPALVAAKIQLVPSVARQVTLLGQEHSRVLLGPTLLVPIEDSLVYVQALYVSSTDRPFPALEYVATDFGGDRVGFATTLLGSLQQIFGGSVAGLGAPSSQTVPQQIETDLALAYAAYEKSVTDGKHFDLGALQQDLRQMGQYLGQAHQLMAQRGKASHHPKISAKIKNSSRPPAGTASATSPGAGPSPGAGGSAPSSSSTALGASSSESSGAVSTRTGASQPLGGGL